MQQDINRNIRYTEPRRRILGQTNLVSIYLKESHKTTLLKHFALLNSLLHRRSSVGKIKTGLKAELSRKPDYMYSI